jgi:hypothetical protein
MLGNRSAAEFYSIFDSLGSSSTTLSNLATTIYALASVNANGTGTGSGTSAGSLYGFGVFSILANGATNYFNVSGGEINVSIRTGASAYYKSILQLVELEDDLVSASTYDCGLAISSKNVTAIGLKTGILFGNMNGAHPVLAAGTLIGTVNAFTVANGIDFSSYTFTSNIFKSNNFTVLGSGATTIGTSVTSPIYIGGTGTTSTITIKPTSGAGTTGADIIFKNGNNGGTEVGRFINAGSFTIGSAAISTSATDGFLYIPTCAGTPTGVPTTQTGRVAMVYDTTNHQFWFYDSGWKQPKTPAGAALVTWQ